MLEQQLLGASRRRRRAGFRDSVPVLPVRPNRRRAAACPCPRAQPTRPAVAGRIDCPGGQPDARRDPGDVRRCAGGLRARTRSARVAVSTRRRRRGFFERAVDAVRAPGRVEAAPGRGASRPGDRGYAERDGTDEAAERWRQILDIPQCHPVRAVAKRAKRSPSITSIAFAIWPRRRTFALRGLTGDSRGARRRATRHRLARIERKLERVEPVYPNPMFGEG